MDDDTVEFCEERTELFLQGFQETKVGLPGTAVVGFFLSRSDQRFL